jgi:16S rRNA (guanine527-N7)-methyltransferase
MIDVGTGAGFPGIPVKILRKDVKVVLLDSLNKRLNFLNEVINESYVEIRKCWS